MKALLKADFIRLFKTRSLYVILAILAGYGIITALLMAYLQLLVNTLVNIPAEISASAFTDLGAYVLNSLDVDTVGLFAAIAIALYGGSDFANKTVRYKITAGYRRGSIFTSSLIANATIYSVYFFATLLVALVAGLFFLRIEFSALFALDMVMLLLIGLAFVCMATFFLFLFRSKSMTMLVNILVAMLGTMLFSMLAVYFFNFAMPYLAGIDIQPNVVVEWLSRINLFSMSTFIYNAPTLIALPVEVGYTVGLYVNVFITSLVWGGAFAVGGCFLRNPV